MKKVTLIIIFLFSCLMLSAQSGFIKVSKGKVTEGDFFKSKLFILPDFTDARIKFTNGEIYEGKVNIHTLSQTLRFINSAGDTFSALNEKMITSVSPGKRLFYKINNQYVQVIDTDGETSLVLSRIMNIGSEKITGAYGGTNDVSSIQKINLLNYDNIIEKVTSETTLSFSYRENLFLLNRGKLFLITKRNLQKFFPSQKAFIEEYYSKNNIKQENREEIITLFKQILSNNL
ncbi:MAG: hypothetical protein AB9833_01625 [Bacteroidales bacterium]